MTLSAKSTYDNDVAIKHIEPLLKKLHDAFLIAAEGMNPDVKWGDTDEADEISGLMSHIWKKYQDRAPQKLRRTWP